MCIHAIICDRIVFVREAHLTFNVYSWTTTLVSVNAFIVVVGYSSLLQSVKENGFSIGHKSVWNKAYNCIFYKATSTLFMESHCLLTHALGLWINVVTKFRLLEMKQETFSCFEKPWCFTNKSLVFKIY